MNKRLLNYFIFVRNRMLFFTSGISKIFILTLVLLHMIGCKNILTPDIPVKFSSSSLSDTTVCVRDFEEMREKYYNDKIILGVLPIMPFGISESESFYEVENDIASDLVNGLNISGLFKKAYYDPGYLMDSDYIIEGEILSTKRKDYRMSYGISGLAAFLWFVGVPQDIHVNEFVVNIRYLDAKNNTVIFNKQYQATVLYKQYIFTALKVSRQDICKNLSRKISNDVIKDIKSEWWSAVPERN